MVDWRGKSQPGQPVSQADRTRQARQPRARLPAACRRMGRLEVRFPGSPAGLRVELLA
jgi:hypothetical protein